MEGSDPHQLDAADREAVLGRGGVGVLSFSTSATDPPHSVPVSYGYDDETDALYFRLAVGSNGAKGDLRDRPATFVTYRGEEDDAGPWESVVARGRLEDIEERENGDDDHHGFGPCRARRYASGVSGQARAPEHGCGPGKVTDPTGQRNR